MLATSGFFHSLTCLGDKELMESIDQCFDVRKELDLQDLPNEEWRDIFNYEGIYQVSNFGRVKSLERYVFSDKAVYSCYLRKPRIIKQCNNLNGYCFVGLSFEGKTKDFFVHRLVAQAFIDNPDNKPQIDHINAIKTDNRVENLRWVTAQENIQNPLNMAHLLGSRNPFYGKKHSEETRAKMVKNHAHLCGKDNPAARKVINLNTGEIFDTVKGAAAFYGTSDNTLRQAIKKKLKYASSYWGYLTKNKCGEVS